MKRKTLLKVVLVGLVLVLAAQVSAQQQQRGRGMYGDWLLKSEFNGRTMESILAFSRDAEGNPTAQWISFMGVSDVQDLKLEDGKLSFTQTRQGRDGQSMTSKFSGTIADGKLTGTMSGDRGEYTLTGEPAPRAPRAVGSYQMKMTMGEREFSPTLVITADKEGTLKGQWKSERGQLDISDLAYNRGTLTFTLKSSNADRQWQTAFEGSLRGDEISGTFKSDRGEMEITGTRIGAEAIGVWNLVATSDRGERKQRLRIEPDMSARYGSMAVEKVDYADGQVSFKIVQQFGDREFEMNFQGKIQENQLTGELTTSMGSQKITGTKVVRQRRNRQN